MYIQIDKRKRKNGEIYTFYRLRESYRDENGKVKKREIANLSGLSEEDINKLKLALSPNTKLANLINPEKDIKSEQGCSVGAVLTLKEIADRLNITKALGSSFNGKLALWQVIARVINQGSRLSATRLAKSHAADKLLKIDAFNEEHLYRNLQWLSDNQEKVEERLYSFREKSDKQPIFLYDVTSSYFEGTENDMAYFGYNRDKKQGKKQIVIGLLCDIEGNPLSVEVFKGNVRDNTTVASQIEKISKRFGGGDIVFVGDRGMIKSQQIKDFDDKTHYITAITKPEIETLLKNKVIQLGMFDIQLCEIEVENVRYILRKNPIRAEEIAKMREEKFNYVIRKIENKNKYLAEHPRASVDVALREIKEYLEKLRIHNWVEININDRKIEVTKNKNALLEIAKLDGCYVLKTNLIKSMVSKQTIHSRYKDLSKVENAFRTMKQIFLELHPIFVRTEASTRGHVFVIMLAYMIVRELKKLWKEIDFTVKEGIYELDKLCSINIYIKDVFTHSEIPRGNSNVRKLLKAAKIQLPKNIKRLKSDVDPRKKLVNSR